MSPEKEVGSVIDDSNSELLSADPLYDLNLPEVNTLTTYHKDYFP